MCYATFNMIVFKVVIVFLLTVTVGAEKKIELLDIEEDNLKSEKESLVHKSDPGSKGGDSGPGPGLHLNNLFRYLVNQPLAPQQRYIHQYAVTEPPERSSTAGAVQYSPHPVPQKAMVGYLSNIPMQVYLVPQYYIDHTTNNQQETKHESQGIARVAGYQNAPEAVQTQTNYIEVPVHVTPSGKAYVQQYAPTVYFGYPAQPTVPPIQATVTPVVAYQVPVIEAPAPKVYYSNLQHNDNNSVDDVQEQERGEQMQYRTHTEIPFQKPLSDFPRHYNSRMPIRDDYRPLHSNTITELPHPNPILLKGSPPHLAHLPKILPLYRPLTKHVYQGGSAHASSSLTSRPHEAYGLPPFKKNPTSLLDSYIPSNVQLEYLKRGLVNEPSAVYEALASGRLPHPIPRHYERGFLPNQMYHTGGGAVTYGHYKRTPKVDKFKQ